MMGISRRRMIKMLAGSMPAVAAARPLSLSAGVLSGGENEYPLADDSRKTPGKYNMNPAWKVLRGDPAGAEAPDFPDASWSSHTLPYAWNEDDAFRKDIAQLSTGIAWYRKRFRLPAGARGKKIFLECEGMRQAGVFYLNGKKIGISENGVMAFGFDMTDTVHDEEENVLAVRTDNGWDYREQATGTKFQWEDRNFYANYGGINKNVYLHVKERLYQTLPLYGGLGTTGVYVYADGFDIPGRSAVIHAESQVRNEEDEAREVAYEVVVLDIDAKEVTRFSGKTLSIPPGGTATLNASAHVEGLHFWSWGYGYLYEVHTLLKTGGTIVDEVVTRTGFRKTAFRDGMIYLNDRVIQVHGYGQRTTNEWPAIGLSVPPWLSDYSNGLMVSGNANLVRWMHVTPWKQDVESCDRVGLMQAMPAGDSEGDVRGTRWEQRKALMREAIVYNRNHPSILFYECGNKGIADDQMAEMKAIRDEMDPGGGRAIGAREMLGSKVAEYGGEMLYIDKSASKPLWAMEFSRDEGLRTYWDDYTPPYHRDGDGPPYKGEDASIYNRNMESHAVEDVLRWYDYWEARPGTGKRVSSGGVNIIFSDTNTHHRGAENYRTSGEVDAMRIPKENFFANQVMWNGWVDTENEGIHLIGHWNYYPGMRKDLYVVTTAEQAELKLNGRSLGTGEKSHRFLVTFRGIAWEAGTLEAIGLDRQGRPVCRSRIATTGAPAALRLRAIPRPVPFRADGHDLALLEVEVTDASGRRCPDAFHRVHFALDGPATWRGGIAKGPGNFILSRDIPVQGGVNRVLIRSTTEAGTIRVRAEAAGLKPTGVTVVSRPFAVKGGLASLLPSAGLRPRLDRGPTPETPSYTVSRITVPIRGAEAGAHPEKAPASYDDNETTAWENDGKASTAWITYRLERPALVSEVVLKLNRFRTRSYPLVIRVDDTVVFRGRTSLSLGYYTAVCKPVRGTRVTVALDGDPEKQTQREGKELSGQTLGDGVPGGGPADTPGMLSIIEIEIYEAGGGAA